MTGDDLAKLGFGSVLAALSALVGWLTRTVLGNKEALVAKRERIRALEAKVAELDRDQLTVDAVQAVIERALDRRDKQADERRQEWDRRFALQIEQAVGRAVADLRAELHRRGE